MAEIDAALDSPPEQPEQEAYLAACSALLLAIARTNDHKMTIEEADVLFAVIEDDELRADLSCGLDVYELVEPTDDQVRQG